MISTRLSEIIEVQDEKKTFQAPFKSCVESHPNIKDIRKKLLRKNSTKKSQYWLKDFIMNISKMYDDDRNNTKINDKFFSVGYT
jgi:hypothetical protein